MGAYANIATWPGRGIRNQFGARLSRTVREGAPMTLSIDDRRFNLMARGDRAWAPDRETDAAIVGAMRSGRRSEEHTSELQSLMRISYAVFCLKKKTQKTSTKHREQYQDNTTK